MSRSLAYSVVLSLVIVTRLPNSPGTRQCPRDAVAETIDEGVHHLGVIDASVVGAVDGPELVDTAILVRREEDADVFDAAGEAQIVVEAICDHRGGHLRLAEVAGRRVAGAGELAQLPE